MDLDLKSRTAVVSGASTGIGRAIARMLALEGVRVVGVARRRELLDTLAQEVKAAGGVRDLDKLLEIRALGVTRAGATRTKEMLDECKRRLLN